MAESSTLFTVNPTTLELESPDRSIVSLSKPEPKIIWAGGLYSTADAITVPWTTLTGVSKITCFFQQMGTDSSGNYTGGGIDITVKNITTTAKEIQMPWSAIGSSNVYFTGGRFSYQHVGDNLVIKWVAKGYWQASANTAGTLTYVDTATTNNGISMVRIEGYQQYLLADCPTNAEMVEYVTSGYLPNIGALPTENTTKFVANATFSLLNWLKNIVAKINGLITFKNSTARVFTMNTGNITIAANSGTTFAIYYPEFTAIPNVVYTNFTGGSAMGRLRTCVAYKSTAQTNIYIWNDDAASITTTFDVIVAGT
jgi:hypothetical protein